MKIIYSPKLSDEIEVIPYEGNEKLYAQYYGGIQAGFPSPAADFVHKKISLDEKYITNPNNTFLVRVKGLSMLPTLNFNDILIVKSNLEMNDNDIVVISVNNSEYTIKRFDKNNKVLVSENKDFKNIPIQDEDVLICLGVVKHLIRDI